MDREFVSGSLKIPGKESVITASNDRIPDKAVDMRVVSSTNVTPTPPVEPGKLDPVKIWEEIRPGQYQEMIDLMYRASGAAPESRQMVSVLSQHDRYHRQMVVPNAENVGYTFITRPRLCLATENLRRDPAFTPLLNPNPNSIGFMIRALLDPKWAKDPTNIQSITTSQFINPLSPFNVPLCNMLMSLSGIPDPYLDTYTTTTGFHGEDQTFAIGSNRLMATYDLSLTFQDLPMAPIAYMFFYWRQYIDNVARGNMIMYHDDIDAQLINYTVSIYRFVMDPTRRYIIKFSKCTGCFPKTVSFGDMMNFSKGEAITTAGSEFTIPFVVNGVEHVDPGIILDFNTLVERYAAKTVRVGGKESTTKPGERPQVMKNEFVTLSNSPISNYAGVPYIEETENGLTLVWKYPKQR